MKLSGPIQFAPHYQPRVWGGRRLHSVLGRRLPDEKVGYGESWEICDRPECQSVVIRGPYTGQTLNSLWVDERVSVFGRRFKQHKAAHYPLLVKILDAMEPLSIQVHPPASVAADVGGQAKTEAWYVFQADPNSQIWAGFKGEVTQECLEEALKVGNLTDVLEHHRPMRGEGMLIESGCVHALGAGLMVFEVQQNSDTTFRLYDWGRLDSAGKPRDLHLEQGLQCYDPTLAGPKLLEAVENGEFAICSEFNIQCRTLPARRSLEIGVEGEHVILMMIRGLAVLGGIELRTGDTVLVPAALKKEQRILLASGLLSAKWLEIGMA
jgi:mannose-6-phosphate isomerase